MAKARTGVPKAIRDQVLGEFNHRCAVCAADRPQLHHIDEDPTNHVPLNLLPLCPNCHLGDEHNPTAGIGPGLLSLFRQFKDPAILAPQFQPLFKRMMFLDGVEICDEEVDELEEAAKELVDFVKALEMGSFFGARLQQILERPSHGYVIRLDGRPDPEYERSKRRHNREYRQQLADSHDSVASLVVESLRFQKWESPTGWE